MTKSSFTKIELGVFLAWSIRHLGALLLACICLAAALHAQAGAGAIVVSSDEWFTSNIGINKPCCQDTLFATNIARFLVPLGGTILIQSQTSIGLGGTSLKALLTGMGASFIYEDPCDNDFLLGVTFDAIFVSGNPANCMYSPLALVAYVKGGGHVFLELGTGVDEVAIWNQFLTPFGLNVTAPPNNISDKVSTSSFQSALPFGNVLFGPGNVSCSFGSPCPPVNNVYYINGRDISQVVPTESCNVEAHGQVFSELIGTQIHGLYAALKCCPPVTLQSSISALVSGPYGTAYVPTADWFSSVPNVSQVQERPGGTSGFWKHTMTGMGTVDSCPSNPV
jgi:hypothetical protein